jgi:hypothetical protein
VVQVNIYGPSTTDRALLDELIERVMAHLRGLGLEPALNVHVPPAE